VSCGGGRRDRSRECGVYDDNIVIVKADDRWKVDKDNPCKKRLYKSGKEFTKFKQVSKQPNKERGQNPDFLVRESGFFYHLTSWGTLTLLPCNKLGNT
jgi:hypothetical protein